MIAGNLFLDFVNTEKARGGQPFETLETFADFLGWTIAAGLLEDAQAESLLRNRQDKSADFLADAIKFRNVLRETAATLADGEKISPAALAEINRQLTKQSGFTELVENESGFEKRFRFDLSEPSNLLQPIAESAADFLCYANFDFLRKCESASCVLYFYDTTKNHRRRWCSMSGCGNKAKAAAFYKRKKGRKGEEETGR